MACKDGKRIQCHGLRESIKVWPRWPQTWSFSCENNSHRHNTTDVFPKPRERRAECLSWERWQWLEGVDLEKLQGPPQTMQTKRECNLSLITCNINRIFQSIYILVTVHVSSEVKLAEKWSTLSNWFDLLVLTTTRFLVYVRLADCLSHLSGEAAPQTPAESESWKSKVKRNVQIIPLGTFTISEKK